MKAEANQEGPVNREGPESIDTSAPPGRRDSGRPFLVLATLAFFTYFLIWIGIVSYTMLLLRSPFLFIKLGYIHLTWGMMGFSVAVFLVGLALRARSGGAWPGWRPLVLIALTGLSAAGLRLYATHWEPTRLQVHEVVLESDKVSKPLRILHISDYQADHINEYERWAIHRMAELKPDIILHTGDLLHPVAPATTASELEKLKPLLAEIAPPLGIVHVMGDTDGPLLGLAAQQGVSVSELTGITVLQSQEGIIDLANFASGRSSDLKLRIFGLLLQQSRFQQFSDQIIDTWWADVRAAGGEQDLTVLMGHAPDYILWADDLPIDLCLAGHTHGGQIRIPGWGPLYWSSKVPRSMARGFHRRGATRMNVSAGVGTEHAFNLPPIRFFCPPEMTLIIIKPAE